MVKQFKVSFNIETIQLNFQDVQKHFFEINNQINCKRDDFNDEVMLNLLNGYRHINKCLRKNPKKHLIDSETMLELNAIVLTGTDPSKRLEYNRFLTDTQKKFSQHISDLMKWYKRHEHDNDDPYKIAAGLYVRILAQPQLFIEGNHRTGSLVANYHLLMSGQMPFILTTHNAIDFFNLASDVKFKKMDIKSRFKRATGWHDEVASMRQFLKANAMPFTNLQAPTRDDVQDPQAAPTTPSASPR